MKHVAVLAVAALALSGCTDTMFGIFDAGASRLENSLQQTRQRSDAIRLKLIRGYSAEGYLRSSPDMQRAIATIIYGFDPSVPIVLTPEELETIQNALE